MKVTARSQRLTSKLWSPSALELIAICLAGVALILLGRSFSDSSSATSQSMLAAGELMQSATELIASYRTEHGPPIDLNADINGTGLIGTFFSEITTTVGNLEAKRTTTNPNMAGLLVALLLKAGVEPGDFIAVGASGSFPALLLATAAAARALDLRVGLILSLGSSQYGANHLDFTWIDMERILSSAELLSLVPAALSYGGDLDVARDLDVSVRELLRTKIDASGSLLIHESNLANNVRQRMDIYRHASIDGEIAAFVNVGGAWANMGLDASILSTPPGLIELDQLPEADSRGVIHAMTSLGIPVIHLLNMRDLVQRYGLPWDPSPLPQPGETMAIEHDSGTTTVWISAAYLVAVTLWLGTVAFRRKTRKRS